MLKVRRACISTRVLYGWVLLTLAAGETLACMVSYRSIEELKAEAGVLVVARIIAAQTPEATFRGTRYAYHVVIDTPANDAARGQGLTVIYEDLVVHQRGALTVCPRKHGSGVEHALETGARYRLYLRSMEEPDLLLAERLENS